MRPFYLLFFLLFIPFITYSQLNADGWTILNPSPTTKILYVSALDGNDQTGEIYTSAHTEIGSDPFLPSGTIMPFKTIQAAADNTNNDEAVWILLKRGDIFFESLIPKSGASENEPFLYASYGSSNESPLLKTGANTGVNYCCRGISNFWVVGISFYAHTRNPDDPDYVNGDGSNGFRFFSGETYRTENILIEGCVFRFYASNVINGPGLLTGIKFRRNLILNNYAAAGEGHSQGFFASNVNGIILEENIFDHNGWYQQANSGNTNEDGQATIFNHNTYFADNHNVTFSSNSFFRTSSIGTKWTANNGEGSSSGLTLTNNFYYDYEVGVSMGGNDSDPPYRFRDIIVSGNVFDQPNVSMQTDRQLGWMIEINDWDNGVLSNNLFVHQKLSERTNCYGIGIIGQNRDLTINNNILYNLKNSDYFRLQNDLDFINSSIFENELTFPSENESHFVNSSQAVDNSLFSNNIYSNAQNYDEGFRIGSDRMNYNEWLSSSGESGSDTTPPSYPDPSRSFDRYVTEILGLSSIEEFYDEIRKQTILNWRPEYTAEYINAWIKEGFGINADTPTIITSSLPNGIVNQSYNQDLSAFGGSGTIIWSITEGNLPTGLTLSETGEISGTPTTPGTVTFTVTITDSNGGEDIQELSIHVLSSSLPQITTASLPAGSVNVAYSQNLSASDGDGTLIWSLSNEVLPEGLTLSEAGEISGTPTTTGNTTFTITVTDEDGDEDSQVFTLTINLECTEISVNAGSDTTISSGETVALNATSDSEGTFLWQPSEGLSNVNIASPIANPDVTTTYTVTITDENGCTAEDSITITLISECNDISVNAGDDTSITSGETVVLNATTDSEGTFLWQPAEGISDISSASPIANPEVTTTYTVTVTDTNGCTGEDSITITVNPTTDISTKYGFSPNNDGINDFWEITGIEQYPDNVVQIFNRWGNLVFEIQGYNNSSNFFDGYANKLKSLGASELPDGTYFFKINIHGEHSLSKTEGYLILKR